MRKRISVAAVWLGALAVSASALAAGSLDPVLVPVPEAGTVAMCSAGMAGIAFLGRRRRAGS